MDSGHFAGLSGLAVQCVIVKGYGLQAPKFVGFRLFSEKPAAQTAKRIVAFVSAAIAKTEAQKR